MSTKFLIRKTSDDEPSEKVEVFNTLGELINYLDEQQTTLLLYRDLETLQLVLELYDDYRE